MTRQQQIAKIKESNLLPPFRSWLYNDGVYRVLSHHGFHVCEIHLSKAQGIPLDKRFESQKATAELITDLLNEHIKP